MRCASCNIALEHLLPGFECTLSRCPQTFAAGVAQMAEQGTRNAQVGGSTPSASSSTTSMKKRKRSTYDHSEKCKETRRVAARRRYANDPQIRIKIVIANREYRHKKQRAEKYSR